MSLCGWTAPITQRAAFAHRIILRPIPSFLALNAERGRHGSCADAWAKETKTPPCSGGGERFQRRLVRAGGGNQCFQFGQLLFRQRGGLAALAVDTGSRLDSHRGVRNADFLGLHNRPNIRGFDSGLAERPADGRGRLAGTVRRAVCSWRACGRVSCCHFASFSCFDLWRC